MAPAYTRPDDEQHSVQLLLTPADAKRITDALDYVAGILDWNGHYPTELHAIMLLSERIKEAARDDHTRSL